MTKLTLENEFGKYSVETKENIESIDDHYKQLIKPLLLASSFSEKTVESYFENFEKDYVGCDGEINKLAEAIEYIKNTQCPNDSQTPYLFLGDISKVIEILTGKTIPWKSLELEG